MKSTAAAVNTWLPDTIGLTGSVALTLAGFVFLRQHHDIISLRIWVVGSLLMCTGWIWQLAAAR
jgi:hypothetical protein